MNIIGFKFYWILIYCSALFFSVDVMAQNKLENTVNPERLFAKKITLNTNYNKPLKDSSKAVFSVYTPQLYYQSLGFMCRGEHQFEQKTKIPLRLRLGSLQYTNWMEQKPNSFK